MNRQLARIYTDKRDFPNSVPRWQTQSSQEHRRERETGKMARTKPEESSREECLKRLSIIDSRAKDSFRPSLDFERIVCYFHTTSSFSRGLRAHMLHALNQTTVLCGVSIPVFFNFYFLLSKST